MINSNALSQLEKLYCLFCLNIIIETKDTITTISLKEQLTVYTVQTNKFRDFLQKQFGKRQMMIALINRLVLPVLISIFNYAVLSIPFIFFCELLFCAWLRPEFWPEMIQSLQSPDYFVSNSLLIFAFSLFVSFMAWTMSCIFKSGISEFKFDNCMADLITDWLENNQVSAQESHFY